MKKVFVHAGWNKTGTTALQKSCFSQIFIPACCNGSRVSIFSLGYNCKIPDLSEDIFISDEAIFATSISKQSICRTIRRINFLRNWHKIAPQTQFIVGIRKPQEMLESLYRQYLQKGGTQKPNGLFLSQNPSSFLKVEELLYEPILEEMNLLFENQHFVYDYEWMKNDRLSFLNALDEYMNAKGAIKQTNNNFTLQSSNKSISYRSGSILRNVNKIVSSDLNSSAPVPLSFFRTMTAGRTPRSILQSNKMHKWLSSKKNFTDELFSKYSKILKSDFDAATQKYVTHGPS